MNKDQSHEDTLVLTTEIVASYVSNNTVPTEDIARVIETVFKTLTNVRAGGTLQADRPQPAVPIKKSVLPDYIICLEDGKKLKMLKRHIMTSYKMTPEQYRERWGLPLDYPMVAPNYAKQRSKLARDIGLGTKSKRKKA
jgi:predicted transcriptional regulator